MSDVPEGYRMSEVDVIPEEWEVKQFCDFAYLSKNYINPQHSNKSYPCIELEHLAQETGLLLGFVESKEQLSQKLIFSRGDVLFGKLRPYLKKFYFAEFDGVCTSEIWVIKSYNNAIGQFLFYLIQSNRFLETANQTSGTKMPRSDWKIVSCTSFLLPPLPEQQAIASALSDVDALITALEQLITKKRNIKQGAMQQLLTGKKRLPGFSGEWEVNELEKLCNYINDGTHHTPKYVYNGVPFYSVENITANNFSDIKYISQNAHNELIKRCKPEKGDILLTRIGTLGETKLIDWNINASIYVSLALLKMNDKIDTNYFYRYTKSRQFVKDIEKSSLLNAVPQKINVGDIGKVQINFPPTIKEQQAIAQILSDMDTEIESLKQKRNKYKAIKQGMMQELLTGKTRLL